MHGTASDKRVRSFPKGEPGGVNNWASIAGDLRGRVAGRLGQFNRVRYDLYWTTMSKFLHCSLSYKGLVGFLVS